jgi:ABC-type glycerol-3-phosphate transport system substrate-binding protein
MPCDSDGIFSWFSSGRQFTIAEERRMKKILFTAAVLGLAACGGEKKAETPAADAPAAAASAAAADTSMHHDSTMARDTTKK